MRRPVRSAVRLAIVTFLAGVLIGVLMPRLFASDARVAVATPRVHVVASGETVWGLAQRFAPDEDSRQFVYQVLQDAQLASCISFHLNPIKVNSRQIYLQSLMHRALQ